MRRSRPLRFAILPLTLSLTALLPAFGCGGGEDKKVVNVDPKFQKKTNTMLENMSKDQMQKYKGKTSRK